MKYTDSDGDSAFPPSALPITRRMSKDEINALPLRQWHGPVHLVRSDEELAPILPSLRSSRLLGFDTETRPAFKKGQKFRPSLLQLATDRAVILFQLNHLGLPKEIREILEDRSITKTGVAVSDDLDGLQQIAFFSPEGFIDLARVSRSASIKHHGLRGMAAAVLGVRISKTARTTNWANLELTAAQIRYAATDAWIGREIHLRLVQQKK